MAINRSDRILALLRAKPYLNVGQLCRELGVSPATVRRDLALLAQSGAVVRMGGGAMIAPAAGGAAAGADPYEREKKRIAIAAAALVKEGDTIFLDAGTTNYLIADELARHSNITIITNSIIIAHKFIGAANLSVIVCGGSLGTYDPACVGGPIAEKVISMFRAKLCFIGTSALDIRHGVTDPYIPSARMKEAMIRHSGRTVLVADRSKFNATRPVFVCPVDEIDQLVTDDLAPPADVEALRGRGIAVTLA